MEGEHSHRWVARVTPRPGTTIDDLLGLNLGLDVWERRDTSIVVAATEAVLAELERRRMGHVERVSTVSDYVARQVGGSAEGGGTEGDPK